MRITVGSDRDVRFAITTIRIPVDMRANHLTLLEGSISKPGQKT